ncbi:MAG: tetratricopeptide repeat protein, partial [Myxococcota bacterium]
LEERARIHYLRGNLLFPRGDLDGCLAEHERARELSRQAGSAELEARAESGLGDARYSRGRMASAYRHYEQCIQLCRKHTLSGIEPANLSMRGLTRYYQCDLHSALTDTMDAIALATQLGHRRAELVARNGCVGWVLYERGQLAKACHHLEDGLATARNMGARRFEVAMLTYLARLARLEGRSDEAERLAEDGVSSSRAIGMFFGGPWALGALAAVTEDPSRCRASLAEGEELLSRATLAHNMLQFCRDGIDACLRHGMPARVEHYAAMLERYTATEPLQWSNFFVARGRALAAWAQGAREPAARAELLRLLRWAEGAEMITAAHALRDAVDSAADSAQSDTAR